MKRAILIGTILAITLLAAASTRRTMAHLRLQSIEPAQAVSPSLTDPQTGGVELTEEFHQSYPLKANGRVSIENVNGGIRIVVWDQNEVKVDAIKKAYRQDRLSEAQIEVVNTDDSVHIKTKYPEGNQSFTDRKSGRSNNPATIEYTITIPRRARLESVELVNGSLDIEGAEGDVQAACVNGNVKAHGLAGEVKLSTVNGNVEATMNRTEDTKTISLESVNGNIVLIIPANSNAQVRASTIHGAITNDFGLQVNDGQFVGHDLSGQIGTGGLRLRLSNVNGGISIKRG